MSKPYHKSSTHTNETEITVVEEYFYSKATKIACSMKPNTLRCPRPSTMSLTSLRSTSATGSFLNFMFCQFESYKKNTKNYGLHRHQPMRQRRVVQKASTTGRQLHNHRDSLHAPPHEARPPQMCRRVGTDTYGTRQNFSKQRPNRLQPQEEVQRSVSRNENERP